MLSLGFVYSFLGKQLKTLVWVSQWERGREILGRALPLKSLKKKDSSEFLFCLPSAQSLEKWIKPQGVTQVKMPDLAQKTKWPSFLRTLHSSTVSLVSRERISVVTTLTRKRGAMQTREQQLCLALLLPLLLLPPLRFDSPPPAAADFLNLAERTMFHIISPKVSPSRLKN